MKKILPYLAVFGAGILIMLLVRSCEGEDPELLDLKETVRDLREVINTQDEVINRQEGTISLQEDKIQYYEDNIQIEDSIQLEIEHRQDSVRAAIYNATDDELLQLAKGLTTRLAPVAHDQD